MGNKNSVPKYTPLGCILRNWAVLTNEFMTKKKMIFFCNTAWPQYSLDSGERWPENGSLNYDTILQLDLFCKREEKWWEIQYVRSFMLLYQNKEIQRKSLVEIAVDVFRNRDKVRRKEEERRMRQEAALLADALRQMWSEPHQCPYQPGARPKRSTVLATTLAAGLAWPELPDTGEAREADHAGPASTPPRAEHAGSDATSSPRPPASCARLGILSVVDQVDQDGAQEKTPLA
uniref:natural cytotoxicity triggering receptor 3 ligand 1-like n=1 Tax=Odobenus rosmarus divergens TaxID=9708 RepID=UPI00063C939D|nr:PREDICTED: natural cytotoxicity triggering receptor 3 ligand 1-like [Odobenus rosmarus divergens]